MVDWLLQGFNASVISFGPDEVKNKSPLFDLLEVGDAQHRPSLTEDILCSLFEAKSTDKQLKQITICISLWSLQGNDIVE